ncbi:MAG: hypothetical protein GX557_07190, partial [Chloroflexi bacterium]|nr:hypothetical protein [Chloroflexota bacterium]
MVRSTVARIALALGLVLTLGDGRPARAAEPAADAIAASDTAGLVDAWVLIGDQAGSTFGQAVATAGDVNGDGHADVLVGAPLYSTTGLSRNGRAYLYLGAPQGLSSTPAWTTQGSASEANYGSAVALAGDVNGDGYADVIVGAPYLDGASPGAGAFYVYHGSAGGLSLSAACVVPGASEYGRLGCAVSTAGDVNGDGYDDVLVGADGEGTLSEAGAAYVYYGSASGVAGAPAWTHLHPQGLANYGFAVGTAGDVNADGYADIVVGAPGHDGEGAAWVYLGSSSGPATTAAWTGRGGQSQCDYGQAVDTAGDVNGDGYSDVVIGARRYDDGQIDEGRIILYHGSPTGLRAAPAWAGQNNWGYGRLGHSAGPAGDVNVDGYADLVAGAPAYTNGQSSEGAAYLFQGAATGMAATAAWSKEANTASARYGQAVGAAGDVNGDGYGDVIVGAPGALRAWVLAGGPSAPPTAPVWTTEGNRVDFGYGRSVASVGDVNGDGYADVLVGSSYQANGDLVGSGDVSDGRADVYYGGANGLRATPDWSMVSEQPATCFGNAVASAGDVNGDGYADIIVGAYLHDAAQVDGGAAYVYHGSPTGLQTTPAWSAYGARALAYYGRAVASAGDVNGDGYADVIIGAYGWTRG